MVLQKKIIHKKILIAPLDWGLGHATRCISLINFLRESGYEIVVASSDEQLLLLEREFPGIATIRLKGYNVNYSKHKRSLPLKILWQVPKILLSIQQEHRQIKKMIKQMNVCAVISDNRYGLALKKIPCVFITHQLLIKTPFQWMQNFLRNINYKFINHFTECWVPDFEGTTNIAGELSHPVLLPKIPIKYIGPLSRFQSMENSNIKYKYLFIISGPEPQRTIFEQKILEIIPALSGNKIILRGKPETTEVQMIENCIIKNHATTDELNVLLNESEFIISRCGYTSVMEILALQRKSILIPTPGQTEQEYLSQHLMKQRWCYTCNQEDDLLEQIQKAKSFQFSFPLIQSNTFQSVVQDFLNKLD